MRLSVQLICLLCLSLSSLGALNGIYDNCKVEYKLSDEDNEGCKVCKDGAFYQKEKRPRMKYERRQLVCLNCPVNSIKCEFDIEKKKIVVLSCKKWYYINRATGQDDSCRSCPENSISCRQERGKIIVDQCEPQFYIKPTYSGDDACFNCPENAKKCDYDLSTKKIVINQDDCESEYFVDSNELGNYCQLCPETNGCKKCATLTKCRSGSDQSQCNVGFYKLGDECPRCNSNCAGCIYSSTNCTECKSTHEIVKRGNCVECSEVFEQCEECYERGGCSSCKSDYYVVKRRCVDCIEPQGICMTCKDAIPSCLSCYTGFKSEARCRKCGDGLFVDFNGRQCDTCNGIIRSCSKCDPNESEAKCLACSEELILYQNKCNTCSSLVSNCASCIMPENKPLCETCSDNFYLKEGKCVTCKEFFPKCKTCSSEGGETRCSNCERGNYITETGSCRICDDSNCVECTSGSVCTACKNANYAIKNGKCEFRKEITIAWITTIVLLVIISVVVVIRSRKTSQDQNSSFRMLSEETTTNI